MTGMENHGAPWPSARATRCCDTRARQPGGKGIPALPILSAGRDVR